MRGMKKGDLAFFYHSNTKVPGVAGIMEIAEEHSVDGMFSQQPAPSMSLPSCPESAFDQNSPYYDPKSSRDNPKWDLVHVRFVRKFSELIPLSELRKYGQPGGALQDLGMLKQSRLSVSSVKPREWHFILGLAPDEDLDDEPEEDLAAVRGQIINVQEKVVRDLNGGETMNGYDADSGDEAVKSKLTIASSIGKEDTEVNA
jgi:predicted RNA-binding protein with PUA-like domain